MENDSAAMISMFCRPCVPPKINDDRRYGSLSDSPNNLHGVSRIQHAVGGEHPQYECRRVSRGDKEYRDNTNGNDRHQCAKRIFRQYAKGRCSQGKLGDLDNSVLLQIQRGYTEYGEENKTYQ